MGDFFNALSDFLSSDLAKGHIAFIIVCAVAIFAIGCFVTWVLLSKVIYATKINQSEAKVERFNDLEKEIEDLKSENENLKVQLKKFEFERAVDGSTTETFEDAALDQFKRKD